MNYSTSSDIDFDLADLPSLPLPRNVLMTSPAFFDVAYVINPHMAAHVGRIDSQEAGREWMTLREAYESLGMAVHLMEGAEGLPDMVFCANQTLPYLRPETEVRGVVLSRMHAPQRRHEVDYFERFFTEQRLEIIRLPADRVRDFEGMGDAIWHPNRHLLWGGYGIRSSTEAYEVISEVLNVRVVMLRLEDEEFYHLDTCFSVLDEDTVLIFPGAFQSEGLELIGRLFKRVIEAPEDESRRRFACNAHCPDGKHVLIQSGCGATNHLLRSAGFEPVEIETGEFLKAGGSVFCMKQMFW